MTEELIISEGYILGQLGFSASAIIGALNITGTWTEIQAFDKAIKAKPVITPTADAAYGQWFSDSADGNKPKFMKPDGTVVPLEGTGGAAPTGATYITVSADATLGAERVLTAGSSKISLADGGPNSTLTIDVAQANLSLSAIGGAVTEGQLPASVVLDTEENDFQENQTFVDAINIQYYEAAQITADQNDYNPTNFSQSSVLQIHSDAARNITGMDNWNDRLLILINKGSFPITLKEQSGSSLAENRFNFGRDIVLGAGKSIPLYYNFQTGRWTSIISSAAFLDTSNTFTQDQTIVENTQDLLKLKRLTNTISSDIGISFQALDSTSATETYGSIQTRIADNVNGSEDGRMTFLISVAGSLNTVAEIEEVTGKFKCGGLNRRIALDETGLTSGRNYTFPNTSTQLAGLGDTNVFTTLQTIQRTGSTDLLTLYRSSNTVGDTIDLNIDFNDSGSAQSPFARVRAEIVDNTATTEDGKIYLGVIQNGTERLPLAISGAGACELECGGVNRRVWISESGLSSARTYTFPDLAGKVATCEFGNVFLDLQEIRRDSQGDFFSLYRTDNSVGDTTNILFQLEDSTNAKTEYARIAGKIQDATNGSEDGLLSFQTRIADSLTEQMTINENGLVDIKKAGIAFSGDISPAQLTADQNDYNPTGLETASVLRLDGDSSFRSITGLAGGADGRIITLFNNNGGNTILLKDSSTLSTSSNRFDFGGDMVYDVPLFAKQSVILRYDGTNSRWNIMGSPDIIPKATHGLYFMEHYLDMATEELSYSASIGTNALGTSEPGAPGILTQTTGASSSGRAGVLTSSLLLVAFGNNVYWRYESLSRISTLSNGTERFTVRIGFIDSNTADPTDGVFFRYIDNVNSGNWVLVARSGGVETVTNSSVPPSTTFDRMTIIVNPAGTSAEFFKDGISLGTVTSNIPTSNSTGWGHHIIKSVGTTSRNLDTDYIEVFDYIGNTA